MFIFSEILLSSGFMIVLWYSIDNGLDFNIITKIPKNLLSPYLDNTEIDSLYYFIVGYDGEF